jgi:hypothetical protein
LEYNDHIPNFMSSLFYNVIVGKILYEGQTFYSI